MYTHTHTLGEWVKERESLDSWPGAAPVTVSFFLLPFPFSAHFLFLFSIFTRIDILFCLFRAMFYLFTLFSSMRWSIALGFLFCAALSSLTFQFPFY